MSGAIANGQFLLPSSTGRKSGTTELPFNYDGTDENDDYGKPERIMGNHRNFLLVREGPPNHFP